jgi:hypothetical protein
VALRGWLRMQSLLYTATNFSTHVMTGEKFVNVLGNYVGK